MTTALKIQKHLKKAAPLIRQILAAKDGLSAYFYFTGNKTFQKRYNVLIGALMCAVYSFLAGFLAAKRASWASSRWRIAS